MARKKVRLAFIEDDGKRKTTFRKRRKGLIKKAKEISTLCGIDACAIIESPYQSQPDDWPGREEALRIIGAFRRMPEMEQNHKMFNNDSFLKQRLDKGKDKLSKLVRGNREREADMMMNECLLKKGQQDQAMAPFLDDILGSIERKQKFVERMREALSPMQGGGSSQAAELQPLQNMDLAAADQGIQRPQWVTDWMNAPDDQIGFGPAAPAPAADQTTMPSTSADPNNNNPSLWPAGLSPYRRP